MQKPEFIQFPTSDGLTLPGLLFDGSNNKKAAIFLHGNGSTSIFYKDEFYLAEELGKKNIDLLIFNNRGAHIIKKLDVVKKGTVERKSYGMAYEKIKECVFDIDGAIDFLKKRGYHEFYLIGVSTGANKICVYNYYKPKNPVAKYALICGGDDTGIYYHLLGKDRFFRLLTESKQKIKKGQGETIIKELLPDEIFSYIGYYDTANPDGDYNTFPFYEIIYKIALSKKPLFRYFKSINKPSLVVYGEKDEYAWGDITRVIDILKKYQPSMIYKTIKGADHGFTGHEKELAKMIADYF